MVYNKFSMNTQHEPTFSLCFSYLILLLKEYFYSSVSQTKSFYTVMTISETFVKVINFTSMLARSAAPRKAGILRGRVW